MKVRLWLMAAVSLALVAVISCEAESGGGAAGAADDAATPVEVTSSAGSSADGQSTLAGDVTEASPAGIDEACVQRVLGRQAAGFGDVTTSERDRILSECTGDNGGRSGPGGVGGTGNFRFGGGGLAALDPACVQGIVGGVEVDFTQMTQEQRQSVFQECGSADGGVDGFGGGFFGQDGDGGFRGGFFGQDGLTGQLPECATEALGPDSGDRTGLTPEDIQAITEACGDLFGGFGGVDGSGGFRGGFFGQDDAN